MSDTNENKMIVGYNPGDFFYSTVENQLTDDICNALLPREEQIDCNGSFTDNSANCVNLELCKNNNSVKQMYGQNKSKGGTDELNYDILTIYRTEYIFMCNLGIAIIGMLVAIYYLYGGSSITATVNSVVNLAKDKMKQASNQFSTAAATAATDTKKGGPKAKTAKAKTEPKETEPETTK